MKPRVAGWKQREGSGSGTSVQLSSGDLHRRLCCCCERFLGSTKQLTAAWWNRSSPSHRGKSLQCHSPTWRPLLWDSGTPNVPTTPNNTFLHHDMWSGAHSRDASSPAALHHYYNKRLQAWRLGTTAPHVIPPFLKRNNLYPQVHWLLSLSHELLSVALPEFSNMYPKTDHSCLITRRKRTYCPMTRDHGDHMRGRLGEISICGSELSQQHLFFCVCYSAKDNEKESAE